MSDVTPYDSRHREPALARLAQSGQFASGSMDSAMVVKEKLAGSLPKYWTKMSFPPRQYVGSDFT
jgi:hypothetical protein